MRLFPSKTLSGAPSSRDKHVLYAVLSVDSVGKWSVREAFENLDTAKQAFKMGDMIVSYSPTARIELTFTTSEIK